MMAADSSSLSLRVKCSFGVASARHVSGVVVSEPKSQYLFDAPLGPSVVRWEIKSGERLKQFQIHSDLIVCMRRSPNGSFIGTASTGGEIKIWNNNWELLAETIAPVQSLFHLSWSKSSDKLLIVSNGFHSSALLYSLSTSDDCLKIEQIWQVKAGQHPTRDPSIIKSHDHESHDQSSSEAALTAREYHRGDLFYMGEINPDGTVLVVEEREGACTMVHLYSPEGQLNNSLSLKSLDGSKEVHTIMISSVNQNGLYVVMAQGGYVLVIKGIELRLVNTIKIGFTSRACAWGCDSQIILPSDSGKLVWVDVVTGKRVHEFTIKCSDFIVHIDWSNDREALWICGFSNLTYCPVQTDSDGAIVSVSNKFTVSTHEISCCGVGFSHDSTHLAVGDLTGNVYLYNCEEGVYRPMELWNVGASVRCIEWLSNQLLLVGCLDGQIHLWTIGQGIQVFFTMEGSVLHMRLSNNQKYFAVGTSKGKLGVFSLVDHHGVGTSDHIICPVSVFTAHTPQPDRHDNRFGQLGKQAEVWSLCWSPNDDRIATCSEDQTVCVWEVGSFVSLATLTGHQLAVTSVDWKSINGCGLLVSCSDDRTIRVYDTDSSSYTLLNVMNTREIHGWHTLTYLTLDPLKDSARLIVSTQHGYLVMFDVSSGETLMIRKMHCGSVEGLRWEGLSGSIASVGGDCAAYIWTLN